MKVKLSANQFTSKITKLKPVAGKLPAVKLGKLKCAALKSPKPQIEIWHNQEYKLSENYQSIGGSYGGKIIVDDNPKAIKAGVAKLEETIEDLLITKMEQHKKLVSKL